VGSKGRPWNGGFSARPPSPRCLAAKDRCPPEADACLGWFEGRLWGKFSGSRRRPSTAGVRFESGPFQPMIDDGDF
jgi:hypothetical protein